MAKFASTYPDHEIVQQAVAQFDRKNHFESLVENYRSNAKYLVP